MPHRFLVSQFILLFAAIGFAAEPSAKRVEFFEKQVRPILFEHCYACHSEQAKERQAGLLLDRRSGWLEGGERGKSVVPGEPDASRLIQAVRYGDDDLQMPPDGKLATDQIKTLERWVAIGAPGPAKDLGETAFSRLGDQEFLRQKSQRHWALQAVRKPNPPSATRKEWNRNPIDQFVFQRLQAEGLSPSPPASPRVLLRRLTFDLTGLPPNVSQVREFELACKQDRQAAIEAAVDRLLASPAFGEHWARVWLDVARYADTDSFYRPDTKTPHYFPFAFTYRDYVVEAYNSDKPFDQFVREQLAADLLGLPDDSPQLAALGFLTVGPHANRNQKETVDDWIDVTTRGLLGMSVACARCHDHKYEPIPTTDYYALYGVFSSVLRVHPLDEKQQPEISGYSSDPDQLAAYSKKRKKIEAEIAKVKGQKARNNNRSLEQKIRETSLAELLLFEAGAPVHAMIVKERPRPVQPYVMIRGNAAMRGEAVPRRFLSVLDPTASPFPSDSSGRLELADRIVSPDNPLTSRVYVNRIWGALLGGYLVDTPSDFGIQGAPPSHPQLLNWLAADFMEQGWKTKQLIRQIAISQTYAQDAKQRQAMADKDKQNRLLWRANRKHLSIEMLRDNMLAVSGQLDPTPRGRAAQLWGPQYTRRRTLYAFVNRFNLDPTLRAFDFPTPMQTHDRRQESIVAPQALFTLNSPFVIDQANALIQRDEFLACETVAERATNLFEAAFQRKPVAVEIARIERFLTQQEKFATGRRIVPAWSLVAQALLMSNEFQYVD